MPSVRYSSGNVVLEPQTYTLRVGDEVHRPEPKVFDLLSYLMRNPGRVVPKSELLDALWSNEVVGESVLTRCVSCARKLINDDSRLPTFVRTVHGRGYEFIAPVVADTISSFETGRVVESEGSTSSPRAEVQGGSRPFVGRLKETAALAQVLANPESLRSNLVLVAGEAGIGKTRLLEEVVNRSIGGAEVHWSRASEVDGAPAFFVWRQCFRSIVKERSMKVVSRALRDATGGTRSLLLGNDRFGSDDVVGWESPSRRFRTFDSILQGLTALARQRALTLVFDDLHNADLTSLLLLGFVAEQARVPLSMIGALRDPEQVEDRAKRSTLESLWGAPGLRLTLKGLDCAEVAQFLGMKPEDEHSSSLRLHARSGGNPFFLSLLAANDAPENDASLPTAVRQAVLERLRALHEPVVSLLTLAAVFGGAFETDWLARAAGLPATDCDRRLRAAGDARLVVRGARGRWTFVHDLVREVLYSELAGTDLFDSHFRVGLALEAVPEYREARHAATLARHMVAAKSRAGSARALDLSIRAGAYALRSFAYEEAIEHFSRARELLPSCADVDPATECAVLLDLGLSQVSAGEREAARATLQHAAEKARGLGAAEELAQVALSLAPGLFAIETGVHDPVLVELLREALDQIGETNPRLRVLLLGRLALALYWADTFAERVRLCDAAAELAHSLRSPDVLAATLTARAFALLRPANLEERRKLAGEAIALSQRAGDHQLLMLNRMLLGAAELERGDVAAAAYEADAFRLLAEETRQPQALWIVEAQRACRLLLDGRLDEVEALAGGYLAVGQRVRDHNALLTFGVHLTLVRIEQGRAGEVLDAIRDYAARYPLILGWRVLYAHALSSAGQTSAAETEFRSLKAREFELPEDLNWMVSMSWLVEPCCACEDGDAALVLYDRLLPYSDRLVVVGYAGIACLGSVQRYLGLLAATLGRQEQAREHFEVGIETNRKASLTLPLAHTLRDYAAFLVKTGETRAANVQLEEAQRLARTRNLKMTMP
jgi:DNA-binding winged helix-turn-helix (wHTH) protein/tetratricopeptide (TPR) repeat protein